MDLVKDHSRIVIGESVRTALVEYDLTQAVERVRYVRFAEYCLIIIWLPLTLNMLLGGVLSLASGAALAGGAAVTGLSAALAGLGIIPYLSAGRVRPKFWSKYFWIFPLVVLAAVIIGSSLLISSFSMNFMLAYANFMLAYANFQKGLLCLVVAAAAAVGVIAIWRLRAARLTSSSYRVIDLLSEAEDVRREAAAGTSRGQAINRPRAVIFLTLGVAIFALIGAPPIIPDLPHLLWLIACFLVIKSRQYFQVSAKSLLAADRRRPILFLRSFVDDPDIGDSISPLHASEDVIVKFVDFSVETRLAGYFMAFGPFIAVGSPREKVAIPGAARVQLADDHWQQWVTEHMGISGIIVMNAGVSHWVNWELSRLVEGGMTGKAILLFQSTVAPKELRGRGWLDRRRRRAELLKEDLPNRLARVKTAFAGTLWQPAWEQVQDPETIIAARFEDTGGVALFRSKRRNNDAFQIAAEIAHLAILGRVP
jgi:hypothetical protein